MLFHIFPWGHGKELVPSFFSFHFFEKRKWMPRLGSGLLTYTGQGHTANNFGNPDKNLSEFVSRMCVPSHQPETSHIIYFPHNHSWKSKYWVSTSVPRLSFLHPLLMACGYVIPVLWAGAQYFQTFLLQTSSDSGSNFRLLVGLSLGHRLELLLLCMAMWSDGLQAKPFYSMPMSQNVLLL